ncbi:MAG: serine/threonine-protein kinase [Polyangiaceae bacterium]
MNQPIQKVHGAESRSPISIERALDDGLVCSSCGASLPLDAKFCPFDGNDLVGVGRRARDSLVGLVIDERYEVLQLLGEGGMGCVYRVRHRVLGRLFALKALRAELARDLVTAERFVQEARAAAAICHPNVVTINDFGMLDSGQPYFVMELLDGRTLSSVLRERGVLALVEAVTVAEKVASALSAAHDAGVIHRDLKPDNIVLLGGPVGLHLKVLDFGLAMVRGNSRLTRDGVVFGTPEYMSPEQATGEPLDAGVDIYSLGILLYEMLTGRIPFEADTYMGVLTQQLYAEPTPPSQLNSDLLAVPELEQLVLRCLRKSRAERHGSMQELCMELGVIGARWERPTSSDSMRPRMPSVRPPMDSRIRRGRRRRRLWTYVAVGVVALGIALALLYRHLTSSRDEISVDPSSRELDGPGRKHVGSSRVDALLHSGSVTRATGATAGDAEADDAEASNAAVKREASSPRSAGPKVTAEGSVGRSGGRASGAALPVRGASSAPLPTNSRDRRPLGSSEIADPWAQ